MQTPTAPRASDSAVKSRDDAPPGNPERRNRTEHEAGEQRRARCERNGLPVERDFVQARKRCRAESAQYPERNESKRETQGAAEGRERDGLEQQAARDAPRARAERGTHGELACAALRANQQQVRDVRARDQQHDTDGAEYDPKHAADAAYDVLLQRPQRRRNLPDGLIELTPAPDAVEPDLE